MRSRGSRSSPTSIAPRSSGCSRSARTSAFGEGEFVLRRGQSEAGLHVIVEGEVGVVLDDAELAVLPRGSFFGEISSLLGEAVVADVISRSPLRCLVIPPGDVERVPARRAARDPPDAQDRSSPPQDDGEAPCLRVAPPRGRSRVTSRGQGDYLPIAEHGIIGDLHSIALVGTDGTIDWYCCPRFDSPSVFGAILDAEKGGFYRIAPATDDWTPKQLYLPDTNVLITRFLTPGGVGEVQDFMPIQPRGAPCTGTG